MKSFNAKEWRQFERLLGFTKVKTTIAEYILLRHPSDWVFAETVKGWGNVTAPEETYLRLREFLLTHVPEGEFPNSRWQKISREEFLQQFPEPEKLEKFPETKTWLKVNNKLLFSDIKYLINRYLNWRNPGDALVLGATVNSWADEIPAEETYGMFQDFIREGWKSQLVLAKRPELDTEDRTDPAEYN